MSYRITAVAALALAMGLQGAAWAAASETAKADAARKKPLQRCDQLNDKAEIDCLHKARERIVEARKKRETVGAKQSEGASKAASAENTTKKTP